MIPELRSATASHTTAGQVRIWISTDQGPVKDPWDMAPDVAEVLGRDLLKMAEKARGVQETERARQEAHRARVREIVGHIPLDVPPEHAHAAAEALLAAYVLKPREAS